MSKFETDTRLALALLFLVAVPTAWAQDPWPEAVADNSFFIEEAYNQEARVVQHIATADRGDLDDEVTALSFTQEWPAPSQRHQVSFTLNHPAGGGSHPGDWGDLLLNYRYQVPVAAENLAVAPRVSLVLPSDEPDDPLDPDGPGVEVNLPVSYRWAASWVGHVNVGGGWRRGAARDVAGSPARSYSSVFAGGSVIWLARPRLNFLLEALVEDAEEPAASGATRGVTTRILSPGLRVAIDRGDLQIVPGLAVPFTSSEGDESVGVFLYLSFEHPF
jgi:hypothetical protein